jgi:uncharacterized protein (TIGR02246 family)
MRTLSVLATVALMICLLPASALGVPNDAEGVRSAVAGFSAAWNSHDMVAFGKLFTTDADFVNVQGLWWRGRKQIQMQHAWSHGAIPIDTQGFDVADRAYYGIFHTSSLQFDSIDVRFLRKDVAVAHVSWRLLGDARTANPRVGLLTFLLTRQDGAWQIAAAQNTEINRVVK